MEEQKQNIKINLLDVLRILRGDKKKIGIYCAVAAVIGLVIAFTTPKTYSSSVMLAPEESGQGFSGSISSLASMVGMNMKLGKTGDALYPEIYPDLVSSTDFVVNLFPVKVTTKDGSLTCDYYTYLLKHQSVALVDYPKVALVALIQMMKSEEPKRPGGKDSKSDIIWLSKEQDEVAKGIKAGITCSVDKKTNVISITVKDQDPYIAATMADSVKEHLQVAITDYRTKKAKADYTYMQELFEEAKMQYDKARQAYALYADANQEVELQVYKMKEEELENEMQLKYNIYQQVVEQLQLAKAKVQESTPAFTIMESASVPVKHSNTPKAVVLIIWIILGFIIRCCILAWKNKDMFIK